MVSPGAARLSDSSSDATGPRDKLINERRDSYRRFPASIPGPFITEKKRKGRKRNKLMPMTAERAAAAAAGLVQIWSITHVIITGRKQQ